MSSYIIGTRFISQAEPELGLGILIEQEPKSLTILYPAPNQTRKYSSLSAPITRVIFEIGDEIKLSKTQSLVVEEITTDNGLYVYKGNGLIVSEVMIDPTTTYDKPEEKLFTGKPDALSKYLFRIKTLSLKNKIEGTKSRGLIGPKINLLPHQFYVASEVVSQPLPRVMLSDEVGLGKTIEAGLILHFLKVNERNDKTLIIVPFSLINQWFIELRRHFHLNATIVNKIELFENGNNPFLDNGLIITSLEFLLKDEMIKNECLKTEWDMLVVDEAHRIQWTEESSTPEYDLIQKISEITLGILLLSATPEKFGHAGHFARLRLLDKNRYHSYEKYIEDIKKFEELAKKIDTKSPIEIKNFIDKEGTGRALFRNTRENIDAIEHIFSKRKVLSFPLQADADRAKWVCDLVNENKNEKFLLITRSKDSIEEIEDYLLNHTTIDYALFYSELTLIERDRNAANFASPEGPQILLCSEVGSEGRNFQFCHNLIFYDLPIDPDIVEQRIGRLDRIGQKSEISIHIPYEKDSFEEILFNWFHEGLDAFNSYMQASSYIFNSFEQYLKEAHKNPKQYLDNNKKLLKELIKKTKETYAEAKILLSSGQNKLLAQNSFNHKVATDIIKEVEEAEKVFNIESYLEECCELFGIQYEEIRTNEFTLTPTDNMPLPSFPHVKPEGTLITYNRNIATAVEEIDYISIDHPMILDLIDLTLSQKFGNVTVSKANLKTPAIECFYTADLMILKKYEPKRFFPTQIIRVLISLDGKDITNTMTHADLIKILEPSSQKDVEKIKEIPRASFKQLLNMAKTHALKRFEQRKLKLLTDINTNLDGEINRLIFLKKQNPSIRIDEIDFLKEKKEKLNDGTKRVGLRLDSFNIIFLK